MKRLDLLAFTVLLASGCGSSGHGSKDAAQAGTGGGGGDAAASGGHATAGTGNATAGSGGTNGGAHATAGSSATDDNAGAPASGDNAGAPAGGGDGGGLPSGDVVYLSDLTPKSAVAFDAPGAPARTGAVVGNDKTLSGKPLVINGVEYKKGIEARAFSQVVYTIGGQYTHFIADTGLDFNEDSTRTGFEVSLDGKLVYDMGNVDKTDVKPIDIDVTGVTEILVYTRTDDNNAPDKDFGIWGGARLTK